MSHRTTTSSRPSWPKAVETLESRTLFSAGGLDPSFDQDGQLFGTSDFNTEDVVVQADGKTVIVGSDRHNTLLTTRRNVDGTGDFTFGEKRLGVARTSITGKEDLRAAAVALQRDGKIVVVGHAEQDGDGQVLVVRYNTDGTLDNSFDGNGIAAFRFDEDSVATGLAIQNDGKIVVAGHDLNGGGIFGDTNHDLAVARLNPNGTLDKSFDGDGRKLVRLGQDEFGDAVAVQADGKIVVVGRRGVVDANRIPQFGFLVTRLNANGSLDKTFDVDGNALVNVPNATVEAARSIVLQPGGRVVFAGTGTFNTTAARTKRYLLTRLLPDGKPDTSFGTSGNGRVIFNRNGFSEGATDLLRSHDGALLVSSGIVGGELPVVKFTADGLRDPSFGSNGVAVARVSQQSATSVSLAAGPGRRFVAAGGEGRFAARFLDAGANLVTLGSLARNVPEGGGATNFVVGRLERLPTPQRVYLNISGTARALSSSPLTLGGDYRTDIRIEGVGRGSERETGPSAGRAFVEIPANETFTVVTFTAVDDALAEGDETATFSIAPDPSYELGTPAGATFTIRDDDGVALSAVADGYVRDGTTAGTNFGSATDLQVKGQTPNFNRISYLKFDLANVATINSAKLRLFGRLSGTGGTNVRTEVVSVADSSWTESGLTFNNRPATGAAALAAVTVIDTTPRFYEFDLTNYLKAEKAAGRRFVSIALRNPAASQPFVSFNSREAATDRPQLLVS